MMKMMMMRRRRVRMRMLVILMTPPTLVEYEVDAYFLCFFPASHMPVGLKDFVCV